MPRVLVYYPFKDNVWFGQSVVWTLNSKKYKLSHDIDVNEIVYVNENRGDDCIKEFPRVIDSPQNKIYIVGHCQCGAGSLAGEGETEEITYEELAEKVAKYAAGKPVHAIIKILACESGADAEVNSPEGLAMLGSTVPVTFLSFAQQFWNELKGKHANFVAPYCHAYTQVLWWEQNIKTNPGGGGQFATKPNPPAPHRFFIDEGGKKQRAKLCRIAIFAQKRA
jgi:hypothetical protein